MTISSIQRKQLQLVRSGRVQVYYDGRSEKVVGMAPSQLTRLKRGGWVRDPGWTAGLWRTIELTAMGKAALKSRTVAVKPERGSHLHHATYLDGGFWASLIPPSFYYPQGSFPIGGDGNGGRP